MKLNELKDMAIFVLEDDNSVMTSALDPDSDLDEENKEMNRELIEDHRKIINKLENDEELTKDDLILIQDANEIHVNDEINLNEHHEQAVKLEKKIKELLK